MKFSEELEQAMQTCETASVFFEQQERILAWPDLRPGQRVAALMVLVHSFHNLGGPTAYELGVHLGISTDRAMAIFDGLEHPPFALTQAGNDLARFLPTQTLEYGKPVNAGAPA